MSAKLRAYAEQLRGTTALPTHSGADLLDEAAGILDECTKVIADGIRRGIICTRSEKRPLADLVPTTWLDPLLSGPSAAIPNTGRIEPTHVEALLRRIKQRIEEAENGR